MKKLISSIIVVVLSCFVLAGCVGKTLTYTLDVAMATSEATVLADKYKTTSSMIKDKMVIFTDEEYGDLMVVDSSMRMLVEKLGDITQLKTYDVSVNEVVYMWGLAKDGYNRSYNIIENHWDGFSTQEKLVLLSFKDSAEKTDDLIEKLLNDPSNININKAIVMISSVAGVALKILPLVVAI